MAAVVTTAILAPFGNPNARSLALLEVYAGADNELQQLTGIRNLMYLDTAVAALYDSVPIDARIVAIT
jgi:tRNA-binding EMAP/Myf-like protein